MFFGYILFLGNRALRYFLSNFCTFLSFIASIGIDLQPAYYMKLFMIEVNIKLTKFYTFQ